MTNPSWGTKRNCPSCSAHFYDLNKLPASCPKCKHEFDPNAAVRAKRKSVRREAPEAKKQELTPTVLAQKKQAVRKKETSSDRADEGGISDIAEMDDVDDIENLQDLSELEEREETVTNGDDADEEAIMDDLDAGEKVLVGNIEEEEASVLVEELEDESDESAARKAKQKKKPK